MHVADDTDRTVEKLLRQQSALAGFGSFAFKETDLLAILTEAARVCAASLGVAYCKVCQYRPVERRENPEIGIGLHVPAEGGDAFGRLLQAPRTHRSATGRCIVRSRNC